MRFKTIFLIVAVALLMLAGAMGMTTNKAEAQDGVIITPTSINRLSLSERSVSIEGNDYVQLYYHNDKLYTFDEIKDNFPNKANNIFASIDVRSGAGRP